MKNLIKKTTKRKPVLSKKLNPRTPEERKKIIREAVQRTVKEYGEALKKLGAD